MGRHAGGQPARRRHPYYDTYTCADGRHVAVGPLEPRFYAQLLDGLGLDPATLPAQDDVAGCPVLRERFTAAFATRTRDEWVAVFDGTEACVTPVLALGEVADHPHLKARGTVVAPDGVLQAAPAPRFSRTPATLPGPPAERRTSSGARGLVPDRQRGCADRAGVRSGGSRRVQHRGRLQTQTRHPAAQAGDGVRPAGAAQADGVSSTSRLRVRFGSTGMPGPVVVETVTFFR